MTTTLLRVLILEDNPADLDLLHRELKRSKLDYVSEVVQTEITFRNALQCFNPDIILSDYNLPTFDGLAAFNIKQAMFRQTPFIIVSGTIGEERAVDLIKNGVNDYVIKDRLCSLAPKIQRALKDAEEFKAKELAHVRLCLQNKQLLEIASLQSHQVRAPLAHILGLFNLFEFNDPAAPINFEIFRKLKIVAESFEKLTVQIVEKTSVIKGGS
jgi:CheY-like chemotaxis protein